MTGPWLAATDPDDIGLTEFWVQDTPARAVPTQVPAVLQQTFPSFHGLVWFWTDLPVPPPANQDDTLGVRRLLCFEEVKYRARVWLDGHELGSHDGTGAFSFDVTDLLGPGSSGRLTVRVVNPGDAPVDGLVIAEIPSANEMPDARYQPGTLYGYGGIVGAVELRNVPAVDLGDVYLTADLASGTVDAHTEIVNRSSDSALTRLELAVYDGDRLVGADLTDVGALTDTRSTAQARVTVAEPRPWSLDQPHLYEVVVALTVVSADGRSTTVRRQRRIGFRSFTVGPDGKFRLNGRPLLLRSTHTGNHVPVGIPPQLRSAFLRQDLVYAKAIGINLIRFITGRATIEQLDLCDEMGLLVQEETPAGWLLTASSQSAERADHELRELVMRDRSRTCVVVWGLLNETEDGPVFRHAVASLPFLRSLDHDRLVLLSSGRWDGDASIGSVANPGSQQWQHLWGDERPAAPQVEFDRHNRALPAYVDGVGDRHLYPTVPHTAAIEELLRTMGGRHRAVFLSEYGIGSAFNVIAELRAMNLAGAPAHLAEPTLMRAMAARYLHDWDRFRLGDVYAAPEHLLEVSQARHAEHRRHSLNLLRSNPSIVGYNLTGMLDHALTGEGLWKFDRTLKPRVMDAVSDGLAPLRWCAFVTPGHGYAGADTQVEIVLANEAILVAGSYRGEVTVTGDGRVAWRQGFEFTVAGDQERPEFAFVVFSGQAPNLPAGEYVLRVTMTDSATPTGGQITFTRANVAGFDPASGPIVRHVGLESAQLNWLADHGVRCLSFEAEPAVDVPILINGAARESRAVWRQLAEQVRAGATAVVVDAQSEPSPSSPPPADAIGGIGQMLAALDLPLRVEETVDWLYHAEFVALPDALFDGLPGPGMLDWYRYGQCLPTHMVLSDTDPSEVAAVSIAVGMPINGGYRSGYIAARWRAGAGAIVVTTFRLLANVSDNPTAGTMLLNLVSLEPVPVKPRKPV